MGHLINVEAGSDPDRGELGPFHDLGELAPIVFHHNGHGGWSWGESWETCEGDVEHLCHIQSYDPIEGKEPDHGIP